MARARKGKGVKQKLGFLIYGAFGTGKSTMALGFARMKREDGKPFRVLYLDPEAGSVDSYLDGLEEEGINTDNIYIVYTQSLKEVNEYIKKTTDNEDFYELDDNGDETDDIVLDADGEPFRPDAIVIDGATILYVSAQQGLVNFSKKRAEVRANSKELVGMAKQVAIEGAGLEIKDYNTLKFDGQNFILSLLESGKHFAVITRETDEKQTKETSEKGNFTSVTTGNKIPEGFKDLAYNVKTVIRMSEDDFGNIVAEIKSKDRTNVHARGEIIENPSLLDWQVVIERGKGKKDYILRNTLEEAVASEEARYINKEGMPEETNNSSATSVKELQDKIKGIVDTFTPAKKKALKPKLDKVGLTTKYNTIDNIEDLQKFLSIVESN